jgi:hypothetical protein
MKKMSLELYNGGIVENERDKPEHNALNQRETLLTNSNNNSPRVTHYPSLSFITEKFPKIMKYSN